jgi:hypothetical protein
LYLFLFFKLFFFSVCCCVLVQGAIDLSGSALTSLPSLLFDSTILRSSHGSMAVPFINLENNQLQALSAGTFTNLAAGAVSLANNRLSIIAPGDLQGSARAHRTEFY